MSASDKISYAPIHRFTQSADRQTYTHVHRSIGARLRLLRAFARDLDVSVEMSAPSSITARATAAAGSSNSSLPPLPPRRRRRRRRRPSGASKFIPSIDGYLSDSECGRTGRTQRTVLVGTERLEQAAGTAEPPRRHHQRGGGGGTGEGVARRSSRIKFTAIANSGITHRALRRDTLFVPFPSSRIVRPSPLKNSRRSSRVARAEKPNVISPVALLFSQTMLLLPDALDSYSSGPPRASRKYFSPAADYAVGKNIFTFKISPAYSLHAWRAGGITFFAVTQIPSLTGLNDTPLRVTDFI